MAMGSPLVKIVLSADEDYCIAIRGNASVVLALRDPRDPFQNWFKVQRCSTKTDAENQSAFTLINEATEQAVMLNITSHNLFAKHCNHREEPMLWASKKMQLGGIMCIYPMQHPSRVFSVYDHIREGSVVHLQAEGDVKNQLWKIVPHEIFQFKPTPSQNLSRPTVTISCRIKEDYNLTIWNDSVMVAPSNLEDETQHWIKDLTYAGHVKDQQNKRAFALVNKATGQAIKHGFGQYSLVRLVQFDPDHFDESILWTEDAVNADYSSIRVISNPEWVFDLIGGQKEGWLLLGQWTFEQISNTNQQWKIKEL